MARTSTKKSTARTKASAQAAKKIKTQTFTKSNEQYALKSQTKDTMSAKSTETNPSSSPVRIHKSTLVIAAIIILLGVFIYYQRGLFVAAVVNGQPITRLQLVQETEKESGKQAMTTLIRNVLVEQEASKENIKVSDKDVADQIKTIEANITRQGQKLDQMLAMEGMTRSDLNKIVYQDLLVTKIVGKDIKVSDKDVNTYLSENKDTLPKGKSAADLKKYAIDQIKKSQLPEKAQTWLSEVEKKAKIIKFVDY